MNHDFYDDDTDVAVAIGIFVLLVALGCVVGAVIVFTIARKLS